MRVLSLLAVAAAAALVAAPAMARTKLVALPDREAVAIRFDNPAATLVEEERVLTLQEGENLVDFSWRGVAVDPDSIRLALLSHPGKVTLLSVSYPPNEAALVWRLHSKGAWEERVRISYLLANVDRLVTYRAVAAKDEKSLDLEGRLVLRNFSGEDFAGATVTLGQGDSFSGPSAHEETRQVLLFTAAKVPVTKTFTWEAARLPWEPKLLDESVGVPVHYEVANSREAGLGTGVLWGGKVRVFQDDGRGGTIFLGEDSPGTTPVGEKMRIYIGDSREVAVTQRKVREEQLNHRPSRLRPVLWDTSERIEAEVENFKDEPVAVDLVQTVPGEWEMAQASQEYETRDANTVVFRVKVPAKGKAALAFDYHRRNVRR